MHRESVSSRADHAVRLTYLNLTGPLIPDSSHQQFRPVFNRSNRQNRSRPESEVQHKHSANRTSQSIAGVDLAIEVDGQRADFAGTSG
jgi:hypothetical protein